VLSMAVFTAFSVFLSGCIDSAPSADEIEVTWGERYAQTFSSIRVTEVSNVSCVQTEGKPGYLCTFRFQTNKGHNQRTELRFVKQGDGWAID